MRFFILSRGLDLHSSTPFHVKSSLKTFLDAFNNYGMFLIPNDDINNLSIRQLDGLEGGRPYDGVLSQARWKPVSALTPIQPELDTIRERLDRIEEKLDGLMRQ